MQHRWRRWWQVQSTPPGERGTDISTSPHSSAHDLSTGGVRQPPIPPPPSAIGLTMLHSPDISRPSADIVFIHGLRGNSMKTWAEGPESKNFWPRDWLPNESGLESTRIWTFGYDSDWLSLKSSSVTSIFDFADLLLFYLKYAIQESQENAIGEVSHVDDYAHESLSAPALRCMISLRGIEQCTYGASSHEC